MSVQTSLLSGVSILGTGASQPSITRVAVAVAVTVVAVTCRCGGCHSAADQLGFAQAAQQQSRLAYQPSNGFDDEGVRLPGRQQQSMQRGQTLCEAQGTGAFTHTLMHAPTHSVVDSLTHSLSDSLTQLRTHSPIRSFPPSFSPFFPY